MSDAQFWFEELTATPNPPPSGNVAIYAKDDGNMYQQDDTGTETNLASGGGGGAPVNATYITQTPDGTLTNEQALSTLPTGLMQSTTGTGVINTVAGTDAGDLPIWNGSAFAAGKVMQIVDPITEFAVNTAAIVVSPPTGYGSTVIRVALRSDLASTADNLLVSFNGDTNSANYISATGRFISGSFAVVEHTAGGIRHDAVITGATGIASTLGTLDIVIHNYASTTQFKHVQTQHTNYASTGAGGQSFGFTTGRWANTGVITSITITPISGTNFTLGAYQSWVVA